MCAFENYMLKCICTQFTYSVFIGQSWDLSEGIGITSPTLFVGVLLVDFNQVPFDERRPRAATSVKNHTRLYVCFVCVPFRGAIG